MPLAEAKTFIDRPAIPQRNVPQRTVPETHYQAIDVTGDLATLRKLALTCECFTPQFGIEESESPECLLLDVTGCVHLFGGEQGMATSIAADFRRRRFQVRVGIAPTIGAAWAAAHVLAKSALPVVVPPSELSSVLLPLPVKSLRLTPNILTTLRELGLRTVGHLRALPRASIPSRFGPLLLKRLDQTFGDEPEFFVIQKPEEPLIAHWEGEFPIKDREALHIISRQLLDQLLNRLKPLREGIRQLRCELRTPCRQSHQFLVGFTVPTDHSQHTFEMLCLQWEQTTLPAEIDLIHLEAAATGSLQVIQRDLFGHALNDDGQREVVILLDRLSNRLGACAVTQAQLLPEPQPELAITYKPRAGGESSMTADAQSASRFGLRPTHLFAPPESIAVSVDNREGNPKSFWWNHREHHVIRCWPERIETGWWREFPASRDYFRVEVQTGHHFWIFHRLDEQGWFIHGVFD